MTTTEDNFNIEGFISSCKARQSYLAKEIKFAKETQLPEEIEKIKQRRSEHDRLTSRLLYLTQIKKTDIKDEVAELYKKYMNS